jgi:hypothetical protein
MLTGTHLTWAETWQLDGNVQGVNKWTVYLLHSYIQLEFVGSLLLIDVSNLFTVLAYVAFKRRDPDEAKKKEAKTALRDNVISFDQQKEWNTTLCKERYVSSLS